MALWVYRMAHVNVIHLMICMPWFPHESPRDQALPLGGILSPSARLGQCFPPAGPANKTSAAWPRQLSETTA